jgi:hypothetical protein
MYYGKDEWQRNFIQKEARDSSILRNLYDYYPSDFSNDFARKDKTKLNYQNEPFSCDLILPSIEIMAMPYQEDLSRRRRAEKIRRRVQEEGPLAAAEMMAGLISMVCAILLFAGEIMSGKSLLYRMAEFM